MSMMRYLGLSKHSLWVIGLLASPLFALPVVESRTGDPVIPSSASVSSSSAGYSSHSSVSSDRAYPNASPLSAEDRAAHLTLTQIEALQREVSELRGLVETQEHQIKQLKKSQQDLYVDLESRIKQMQNGGHPSKLAKPAMGAASESSETVPSVTPRSTAGSVPSTDTSSKTPKNSLTTNASSTPPKPGKPKETKLNEPEKVSTTPAKKVSSVSGEHETYLAAYNLVRTKRYAEAVSGLQAYLNQFPNGENAGLAHYWLGEVYLLQWQNEKTNTALVDKASHEFSTITAQFPNHPKAMDAILKLGLIEFDKGNPATAEQYLTEVKKKYPGTAAARLAETRLQQISSD